jgi:hypothetical protein
MGVIVWGSLVVLGFVGMVFILRNYRRQAEDAEGPGIVPEDY